MSAKCPINFGWSKKVLVNCNSGITCQEDTIFMAFSNTEPVLAEAYCGNKGTTIIFLKPDFLNKSNALRKRNSIGERLSKIGIFWKLHNTHLAVLVRTKILRKIVEA